MKWVIFEISAKVFHNWHTNGARRRMQGSGRIYCPEISFMLFFFHFSVTAMTYNGFR